MHKIIILLFLLPFFANGQSIDSVSFLPEQNLYILHAHSAPIIKEDNRRNYLDFDILTTYFASDALKNSPNKLKIRISFSFRVFKTCTIVSGDQLNVIFTDGTTGTYVNKGFKQPVDSGNTGSIDFAVQSNDKLIQMGIKSIEIKVSQAVYNFEIPSGKSELLKTDLLLIHEALKKLPGFGS